MVRKMCNPEHQAGVDGIRVVQTIANTKYIAITMSANNYNTYKSQIQVEGRNLKQHMKLMVLLK